MIGVNQYQSWFWTLCLRVSAALAFAVALLIAVSQSAAGQTFSVLHAFAGGTDGAWPMAGLTRDAKGDLYGTTSGGGDASCGGGQGCGTVFKLTPAGKETVLRRFQAQEFPGASLILDSAGNLYSTTSASGTNGFGTVFKLDAAGEETVLHSFSGGTDGASPSAGLIQDSKGNFYGTTYRGGAGCCGYGKGVVFKLDPTGHETVLHRFGLPRYDGEQSAAELIRDSAGNLYGTTAFGGGGSSCSGHGCGVVFRVDPAGKETVLYRFTGGNDGAEPFAGLVRDSAGNLYGTTYYGGTNDLGVVFKLDRTNKETILHTFTGPPDGAGPDGALFLDASGNLYGTTSLGGETSACSVGNGCGTVYQLRHTASGWKETVLYRFDQGTGTFPMGALIRDPAGNFYGTTYQGGGTGCSGFGCGVVFRLKP
jgi:uncharacterized repeat protein (TIGR03803 family)